MADGEKPVNSMAVGQFMSEKSNEKIEWDIDAGLPLYTRDWLNSKNGFILGYKIPSHDLFLRPEDVHTIYNIGQNPPPRIPRSDEPWAAIENRREQIEAMLGMKLADYQWDYFQHFAKGEKLVRDQSKRQPAFKWVLRGS